MSFTGNIAQIDRLAAAAAKLRDVPPRAARQVAVELYDLIGEEFDEGHDPYGTAWAPLAPATEAKGRSAPPLTDTGDMHGSLNVFARASGGELTGGIAITIDHPARPHQSGWSGPQGSGPARPILPEHGLPGSWDKVIYDATSQAIKEVLR